MENCIVVDIDGTIALKGDRIPYDWDKVGEDEPNKPVLYLVKEMENIDGVHIVVVSGRDGVCRRQTEMWLDAQGVQYASLHLRPEEDNRKDSIIKEQIYNEHIKGKYNVLFVLDDRNQTVAKWRELGLTCLQVADGDF